MFYPSNIALHLLCNLITVTSFQQDFHFYHVTGLLTAERKSIGDPHDIRSFVTCTRPSRHATSPPGRLALLTFVCRPLAPAHEDDDDADDEHHDDGADDDRDHDHQVVVLQPLPPAQVACKQTRDRSRIVHNNHAASNLERKCWQLPSCSAGLSEWSTDKKIVSPLETHGTYAPLSENQSSLMQVEKMGPRVPRENLS